MIRTRGYVGNVIDAILIRKGFWQRLKRIHAVETTQAHHHTGRRLVLDGDAPRDTAARTLRRRLLRGRLCQQGRRETENGQQGGQGSASGGPHTVVPSWRGRSAS